MEELGKVIVKEEYVIEKFDGDEGDPNRVLRERILLEKHGAGELETIKTEFFDTDGNHIKTLEGGK
jgi:hypothetical protein